ncbi:hypothetical protein G4B88_026238 [Cannabis sativa]|uniref:YABBY protein C-terminal domain-containing protein n=1 Tax=Cannabis sativa TaxID=3483 RepID=A0A7J6DTN1_CANSA|nr:hypothetical protein G4B88_026238 [Cannabis sativa]
MWGAREFGCLSFLVLLTDPWRRDREFPRHTILSSRMRSRIKSVNPDISHKEAFSAAAKNWAHFPHIHFGPMPDWEEDKCSPAGRRRRSDEGWVFCISQSSWCFSLLIT